MQLSEIQSKIYALTGTDSSSYTNAQMAIDLNIWQNNIAAAINASQDESDFDDTYNHGDYPSGTYPLTTNRDIQIAQGENVINIRSVSVSYDGVNYCRAEPIDMPATELAGAPASATAANARIDSMFPKTAPRYDIKYNSIFLYPKPTADDVAAGGKAYVEWSRNVHQITEADLSAGTLVPGFDINFHPMLCYGPSYEFLWSKKQFDSADRAKLVLDGYEAKLASQYGSKAKDRQMSLQANDEITQGYR